MSDKPWKQAERQANGWTVDVREAARPRVVANGTVLPFRPGPWPGPIKFDPGKETPLLLGMSNADHSIDAGFESALREGLWGRHAAQEFNGKVWWEPATALFMEEVWRHHRVVGYGGASSLNSLMRLVNDKWGWE